MPITRFPEVALTRVVQGKCSICARPTRRTLKVSHTMNPFNRNKAGYVKSRDEVLADVRAELDAKTPDFDHAKCKTEATS